MSKYKFTTPSKYTPPNVRGNLDKIIKTGKFTCEAKIDGNRQLLGKTLGGQVFMTGRRTSLKTGMKLDKIGHVPHLRELAELLPAGTVLDGEACVRGGSSRDVTKILGSLEAKAIEKQTQGPMLHYVAFDVITLGGESLVEAPKYERNSRLVNLMSRLSFLDHHDIGLVESYRMDTVDEALAAALRDGYEGLVVKDLNGAYNHLASAKIKPMQTFDMVILGYDDSISETFAGNGIAALQLGLWNEERGEYVVTCRCSGMTHEQRRSFYNNKLCNLHKVVEITGQEMFETGAVRHPVYIKMRYDVEAEEQTFKKYDLNE